MQGNIIFQAISRTTLQFSGSKYTKFKGYKPKYVQKAYHIYSVYDRLLTFICYSLLLTPSSCLMHPLLFKFELTQDIETVYQYSFSSTIKIFVYRHNIYTHTVLFEGNIFSIKFEDISRTCKINLLFSRMHWNPVIMLQW